MGNIIGTIYYDSSKKSSKYGRILINLRNRHNLNEISIENLECFSGKVCDGVEISEIWVQYYGEEVSEMKIISFLKEAKKILEQAGATGVEIDYKRTHPSQIFTKK